MLCLLCKDNKIIITKGAPDIYLFEKDFYKVLQNPNMISSILDELDGDFSDGVLLGRLGVKRDGIYYCDSKVDVSVDIDNKRKEYSFYESVK